jgi:micrococcal nuclease
VSLLKNILVIICALILLLQIGCVDTITSTSYATTSPANRVSAQVIRVIDGDTIKVNIDGVQYTIRYIGIDAPESVKANNPVEPFGLEASAKNKELVEGKVVMLEKDVSETDQYGRSLRYVYVGDLFINAELVRLGYAQAISYPPDIKYQDLFRQLQREARNTGKGLWGNY